jgi:phosphate binding protein
MHQTPLEPPRCFGQPWQGLFPGLALALLLPALLAASICLAQGADTAGESSGIAATGESLDRGAVLRVKGSNTIGGSLGPAWARRLEAARPGVEIRIEALGSSTGFAGLFDGSADLAAASRPIRDTELEQARRLGISLREYVIGYDGIAVIVHPDNPVRVLTAPQLALVFSGAISSWAEVGGDDLPILRLSRPSYSGTHGFFKEHVVQGPFAPDTVWIEENEEIIDRVSGSPGAASYIGFSWVDARVRAVSVAAMSSSEAVAPSERSMHEGSYPICRPLLLYTVGEPAGLTRELIDLIYSDEGRRLMADHGFVPADLAPSFASADDGSQSSSELAAKLLRIRFASSSHRITPADREALEPFIVAAIAGEGRLVITGHADSLGDPETNRRVALARARAVASYVVEAGVGVDLVSVEGVGSDRPIASNQTPQGRWLNRRVDVRLVTGRNQRPDPSW